MTIDVLLNKEVFRRFTIFDILKRRKLWRSPTLFALILGISACICFLMRQVDGAILLGAVLLIVGLGMPCIYFLSFFRSLNRQIIENDLLRPKKVYTLHLTDGDAGIAVDNGREHVDYRWSNVYRVYRDTLATYLYITPERAFLLPHDCVEESADALWKLIGRNVPSDRIVDLRKT